MPRFAAPSARFVLGGLANALDRTFPVASSVVGIVAGVGPLIAGLSGFVGRSLIPEWLVFTIFLGTGQLWLLGLAYHLWRRASRLPVTPHPGRPSPRGPKPPATQDATSTHSARR